MGIISLKNKLNKGTVIIAEVGLSHDGSLLNAISHIDALAEAGVDVIKFQMHDAQYESSTDEKFRINLFLQDKTRYDYWERTAFSQEEWKLIANRIKSHNILFACTPFSLQSLESLLAIGVDIIKIGSAEAVFFKKLIIASLKSKIPTIISSGMSDYSDIKHNVRLIKKYGKLAAILHCVSSYPTKLNEVDLKNIEKISKLGVLSGISDHSGNISVGLTAIANKVDFIEIHSIIDKKLITADTDSSLTCDQIKGLVKFRNDNFILRKSTKKISVKKINSIKNIFGRSFYASKDILKGEKLSYENIILLKPGGGIPENEESFILGKKVNQNIKKGNLILKRNIGDSA